MVRPSARLAVLGAAAAWAGKGPEGRGIKVIGIGPGRTGTQTLRAALEMLGHRVFGDAELVWNATIREAFGEARRGRTELLRRRLEEGGYTATTGLDEDASLIWQLFGAADGAKAILTTRSLEGYYQSLWKHQFWESRYMSYLIGPERWHDYCPKQPNWFPWLALLHPLVELNPCPMCAYWHTARQKRQCMDAFALLQELRQQWVPKEQTLVYDVREGWGPLCKFLGVQVPEEPFPRVDSSELTSPTFREWRSRRFWADQAALVGLYVLLPLSLPLRRLCRRGRCGARRRGKDE